MRPLALLFALIGGLAPVSVLTGPSGPREKKRDPRVEGMAQAKREIRQRRNLWLVERGGLKAI